MCIDCLDLGLQTPMDFDITAFHSAVSVGF